MIIGSLLEIEQLENASQFHRLVVLSRPHGFRSALIAQQGYRFSDSLD
tara:strand:- start:696 stop:839 length:144 start_codon:yes stop_codon:yes gene_type:complete